MKDLMRNDVDADDGLQGAEVRLNLRIARFILADVLASGRRPDSIRN